jgi:hypothetical protein
MTSAERFDARVAREVALAELDRAPERVYFDEVSDAAAADAYYRNVDATELPKLTALVSRAHLVRPPYAPGGAVLPVGRPWNPTCP